VQTFRDTDGQAAANYTLAIRPVSEMEEAMVRLLRESSLATMIAGYIQVNTMVIITMTWCHHDGMDR
jgi:hypothetical protein